MVRPLRIAVTLEQCWHRVPGGTATSALASVSALAAAGVDVVGVSARHGAPPPEAWRPSITVDALPLPRLALYEAWHRLRRPPVQWATGPVDVIHATGMAVPPPSAPLVVTVHDLAFLHDPSLFTARGVRFFHRAIELARRDAQRVVCPSQATIDECVAAGFAPERLRLVPWGVDATPVTPEDADAARRRFGLDRPYVFWTGTLEPRKNVGALVEAFGRLARDDVDLVLGGPEGWNDELERLSGRLGGRIRRIGFVPVGDLRALYAGAELFCFPSRAEGFGLPVLEAMAQGCPVVTSAGTATAEVVGDDSCGVLVEPGDVEALTGALARLLDDGPAAAAMGEKARARAATFTWARTAERLLAVYREARVA
jgi:glycosyltransferase involved in cell wall biosynthesis